GTWHLQTGSATGEPSGIERRRRLNLAESTNSGLTPWIELLTMTPSGLLLISFANGRNFGGEVRPHRPNRPVAVAADRGRRVDRRQRVWSRSAGLRPCGRWRDRVLVPFESGKGEGSA